MVQRGDVAVGHGFDDASGVRDAVDGSAAEVTVRVSLDGVCYLIPLSRDNAGRLRDELSPWLRVARRVAMTSSARRTAPVDRTQLAKIRSWARQNGHRVNTRGRIPAAVQQAFADAHA